MISVVNIISCNFTEFVYQFLGGVFSMFILSYRIISSETDNFTSSFPMCMLFISFSFLIALAKTSDTMNRSG